MISKVVVWDPVVENFGMVGVYDLQGCRFYPCCDGIMCAIVGRGELVVLVDQLTHEGLFLERLVRCPKSECPIHRLETLRM